MQRIRVVLWDMGEAWLRRAAGCAPPRVAVEGRAGPAAAWWGDTAPALVIRWAAPGCAADVAALRALPGGAGVPVLGVWETVLPGEVASLRAAGVVRLMMADELSMELRAVLNAAG
ncbi:MAG: hypothetical protein HY904_03610 [Deltaproteobacteria bacterium]|nr:hypothetical protein [Deltaproteobacteria bacterium]